MSFRLRVVRTLDAPLYFLTDSMRASSAENLYTVLIGKNGTGKTRALASVCEAFTGRKIRRKRSQVAGHWNKHDRASIEFDLDGNTREIQLLEGVWGSYNASDEFEPSNTNSGPSKIIAVTVSPFDKFPLDNLQKKRVRFEEEHLDEDLTRYVYLGQRNYGGQITRRAKVDRLADAVLSSLSAATLGKVRLGEVFDHLGYRPSITLSYIVRLGSLDRAEIVNLDAGGLIQEKLYEILRINNLYLESSKMPPAAVLLDRIQRAFLRLESSIGSDGNLELDIPFSEKPAAELNELIHEARFLRGLNLIQLDDILVVKNGVFEGSIDQASSGEQSLLLAFLGVATAIKDNALVIIDEPEIGLHPEWQADFVTLLDTAFKNFSGCHFVLATHSPQILSLVGARPCAVVDMNTHETSDASTYWKRSSDFQLTEVFNAPGYRNEYLTREALTALQFIYSGLTDRPDFLNILKTLNHAFPNLAEDDPVKLLIGGIRTAIAVDKN